MLRRLILTLIVTALLGICAAYGGDRELTSRERQELEQLRRDKWDQGCSDEEIQSACDRRREEMLRNLKPKGEAPDPGELDRDFQDLMGALDDVEKLLPRVVPLARGNLQQEWSRVARDDASQQQKTLKELRFRAGGVMFAVWARNNGQKDYLSREFNPFVAEQKDKGLRGEDLLDAVITRFAKVPEQIFDLFDPEDPFPREVSFTVRENLESPKDPPDAQADPDAEATELTEADVDEIVDELMLEMMEEMGR